MKNAIRQSCRRLLAAAALLLAALLTAPGALAQATVTYFHNDAAGTPWLATDQSGAVLWKENYLPYGYRQKAEPASADNKLWFTGRPYDPDTGMAYMGARYYMPLLGRFTGMDPKEVNPEQIRSFNRYAYANNNPNSYIDPDGKLAETVWDAFNISLGFQSLVSNVREGNWSSAAVDAAGIAMDGVAAAIPVVPGGVGASIAAYRAVEGTAWGLSVSQTKLALSSAQNAYKGSTVVGHALAKHSGRHPETWGKMSGSMGTWNEQGMNHFRDIIRSPGKFTQKKAENGPAFPEKRIEDGRGVRLNMDGTFKGFLD